MTRASTVLLRRALPLLLAAFVAACTVPEDEFGECEPGVGELGRTRTVCP